MNKKIVSAAVCAALLMALMTGASAARSIEVLYDDIQITLNGERVETADANGQPVEPFIYDGTTYIPARAVAEAFGKNVEWLPESGEVAITDADADSGVDGNAGAAEETLNDYLIARSRALTAEIAEMAGYGEYMRMLTASDEINKVVDEIGAADYANPREAIIIRMSDDFLDNITDVLAADADTDMPMADALYGHMRSRVFLIASRINGMQGIEVLSATSALTTMKSCQSHSELTTGTHVILIHDGDYASWVSFQPSEENTVMVSAQFVLLNEEIRYALTAGSVEALFGGAASELPGDVVENWFEGLEIEIVDLTGN